MTALIIIDMQVAGLPQQQNGWDTKGVIERIRQLCSSFRRNGLPVIFIQHDGNPSSAFAPDSPGWKIIPELDQKTTDIVIRKTICDAFYKTSLQQTLSLNKVKHLFITGWATDYCVDTTVRAAVSREYQLTIASDAHTCANRPSISAEQVRNHHNHIWAELLVPSHPIRVIPTKQILSESEKQFPIMDL